MSTHADFQNAIYAAGAMEEELPGLPFDAEGMRRAAESVMTTGAFSYVDGSAGSGRANSANQAAFLRYPIAPRNLRRKVEGAGSDLGVTLFGSDYPSPILTAPVGVLEQVHPEADCAVARAANAVDVPIILSSAASTAIEDLAAVADRWWFQLYWSNDEDIARSFVERATSAGAEAIVVTADTARLGWRPRDLDLAYLPFLKAQGIANYFSDPAFIKRFGPPVGGTLSPSVQQFLSIFGNRSLDVDNVLRIREWTDLPIVVKGVLRADEAIELVDNGVDGLVVSNHGGRQIDNTVAALDVLPKIVDAVGDRATVMFDSGIRSGADVAIALALGAQAVLVARPWVFGLGVAGERGVQHVLECFLAELQIVCELLGADARDLTRDDLAMSLGAHA